MGFSLGPDCNCCGCSILPEPYRCYYAVVTISGVVNNACSDCGDINGVHKLPGGTTSGVFIKYFGNSAAEGDCSYPTCAARTASFASFVSITHDFGTPKRVTAVSIQLTNNSDPTSRSNKAFLCNSGTWTVTSNTTTGSNPPCNLSAATVSVEFIRAEPCFCERQVNWLLYDPDYVNSTTKLSLELSGTAYAALNTTHQLDFSADSGNSLRWSKTIASPSGFLRADLAWKQVWGGYNSCTAFDESIQTSCRISHTGVFDLDFRNIGGIWTPKSPTTGSVVSLAFV